MSAPGQPTRSNVNHRITIVFCIACGLLMGAATLTTFVTLAEIAAPSAPASGSSAIYADSTSHTVKISVNGGSFFDLITTATSVDIPFSVGPTAATTASLIIGSFVCRRACTITKGWTKALTQGTIGSTATTILVTDGVGTCTLTSGSGCNAAAATDEVYTASGSCAFAAAARLNVTATKGDCTVGPSFYNLAVEVTQ